MINLAEVQGPRPGDISLAWRRGTPNENLFRKIGDCLKSAQLN